MNEKHRNTVPEWAEEDKPREKLLNLGKKNVTDAELIAILLGSGSPGENVVDLAKRILRKADNNLNTLRNFGISDLQQFHGVGEAKAITITAALELGYRLISHQTDSKSYTVSCSQDIFNYIAPTLIDLPYEEFWVVFLNVRNKIIGKRNISSGGSTETSVDIRKIFQLALESKAVSIAVAHNHPSGSVSPSKKDKDLTERISEAGKLLRIQLLEHLVVGIDDRGDTTYFSFYDNGLL